MTDRIKTIRLLLIEDNRILREGITATLNREPDIRVVAAIGGRGATLSDARKYRPQLVLVDLGLRNQEGPKVVKSLLSEFPGIKLIGMGLIPSQSDVIDFVEAGASGFILKDATIDDVLSTIRAVARGAKILPPVLTSSLFTHVVEYALRKGKGNLASAVRMTKREREIIGLISDGMSNKDIARELNIAVYTVKSHVHNVLEKLALNSRLQIAHYSRTEGEVS